MNSVSVGPRECSSVLRLRSAFLCLFVSTELLGPQRPRPRRTPTWRKHESARHSHHAGGHAVARSVVTDAEPCHHCSTRIGDARWAKPCTSAAPPTTRGQPMHDDEQNRHTHLRRQVQSDKLCRTRGIWIHEVRRLRSPTRAQGIIQEKWQHSHGTIAWHKRGCTDARARVAMTAEQPHIEVGAHRNGDELWDWRSIAMSALACAQTAGPHVRKDLPHVRQRPQRHRRRPVTPPATSRVWDRIEIVGRGRCRAGCVRSRPRRAPQMELSGFLGRYSGHTR